MKTTLARTVIAAVLSLGVAGASTALADDKPPKERSAQGKAKKKDASKAKAAKTKAKATAKKKKADDEEN